jgi:hypothetical protein
MLGFNHPPFQSMSSTEGTEMVARAAGDQGDQPGSFLGISGSNDYIHDLEDMNSHAGSLGKIVNIGKRSDYASFPLPTANGYFTHGYNSHHAPSNLHHSRTSTSGETSVPYTPVITHRPFFGNSAGTVLENTFHSNSMHSTQPGTKCLSSVNSASGSGVASCAISPALLTLPSVQSQSAFQSLNSSLSITSPFRPVNQLPFIHSRKRERDMDMEVRPSSTSDEALFNMSSTKGHSNESFLFPHSMNSQNVASGTIKPTLHHEDDPKSIPFPTARSKAMHKRNRNEQAHLEGISALNDEGLQFSLTARSQNSKARRSSARSRRSARQRTGKGMTELDLAPHAVPMHRHVESKDVLEEEDEEDMDDHPEDAEHLLDGLNGESDDSSDCTSYRSQPHFHFDRVLVVIFLAY